MTRCPHVGTLLIGGHPIGEVRCELDAGHDEDRWHHPWDGILSADEYAAHNYAGGEALARIAPTPHRASFEWDDDLPVVLEAPEDGIEVDVPVGPVPDDFVPPAVDGAGSIDAYYAQAEDDDYHDHEASIQHDGD